MFINTIKIPEIHIVSNTGRRNVSPVKHGTVGYAIIDTPVTKKIAFIELYVILKS